MVVVASPADGTAGGTIALLEGLWVEECLRTGCVWAGQARHVLYCMHGGCSVMQLYTGLHAARGGGVASTPTRSLAFGGDHRHTKPPDCLSVGKRLFTMLLPINPNSIALNPPGTGLSRKQQILSNNRARRWPSQPPLKFEQSPGRALPNCLLDQWKVRELTNCATPLYVLQDEAHLLSVQEAGNGGERLEVARQRSAAHQP